MSIELTERWAVKAWEGRAASAEVRVYLASEADAVIDKLEAKVKRLRGLVNNQAEIILQLRQDIEDDTHLIKDMQAEFERLRVDAERYAWLRDGTCYADDDAPVVSLGTPSDCICLVGDELDAAIDKARGTKP